MKFKFLKQKNINDCGVAVSAMLINYYCNRNFSLEDIKYENKIQEELLSFLDIENILLNYGIEFISYSCTFKELKEIDISKPHVLSLCNENNETHFIIIIKKNKNKCLIADPNSNDFSWIKIDDLENKFSGFLGLTKLNKKIKFEKRKVLNWYCYLNSNREAILSVLFISIVINFLILLNSNFLKKYINELNFDNQNYKIKFFIIFIMLSLFEISLTFTYKVISKNIKNKIIKNIFSDYISKLNQISIEEFKSLKKEEWYKKIAYIRELADMIVFSSINIPVELILFILTLIVILNLSPVLLIIILIDNFIVILISILFNGVLKDKYLNAERKTINFSKKITEYFNSYEEIKYKKLNNKFIKDINVKANNFYYSSDQIEEIKIKINSLISLVNIFFYYLLFYISYLLILKNTFNVTELLFYTTISVHINGFFNTINGFLNNYESYKIASNNLFFIFTLSKKNNENAYKKIKEIKSIEFKNITKYIGAKKCIKDFNYTINDNTLIYGKSGVGKTSILKIVTGFFNSFDGELLINGTTFKDIDKENYSNNVIYLGQYDFIFDGTVWENIQQFKNKIDVNLFKSYYFFDILKNNSIDIDKEVYDNGANLSKGQRQIINFMSLFFIEKQVYLIDEPLSNVEKETAYYLFKLFYEKNKDKLIIMTDHDPIYRSFFPNRIEVM
ncbi:bacteriocin ABC transporter [Spiroplasma litorale]|uniref:Bacteriocin ABC transporter n=1 Tax=Spiroplasma litorale TaxID=216942 RepID=A0A0K1W191_9MOLU|nr:cysteine peptidase family C39 domain-containing protein [Spiroplasma litorale]AKX33938.1 bacteriocin ABC transporter [Spiroplasma litorale]